MNACPRACADPPVERTSERVAAGGHDWHVDRWRAGSAAPVCLILHGTGASSDSVAPLALALADRYEIVAPDLPAHARTRTPPDAALDIDAQARALAALLDALRIEPALAIGHSAGAVVLAAWSLARVFGEPTPPLVAINGAMLPLEGPAGLLFEPLARLSSRIGWLPRLVSLRAEREPDNVRRLLESTGSCIDDAMEARYRPLLADPAHTAGVLRMMASWQLGRFAPRLARLGTHVHLLAGDNDRTIPLRQAHRLLQLLPDAHLDVLPGLGHLAHEEQPALVAERVLRHLDERRRAVERHTPRSTGPVVRENPS